MTDNRTLNDPELVRLVATAFLTGFITPDWRRPHEKAALTKAKEVIKTVKRYLAAGGAI